MGDPSEDEAEDDDFVPTEAEHECDDELCRECSRRRLRQVVHRTRPHPRYSLK